MTYDKRINILHEFCTSPDFKFDKFTQVWKEKNKITDRKNKYKMIDGRKMFDKALENVHQTPFNYIEFPSET